VHSRELRSKLVRFCSSWRSERLKTSRPSCRDDGELENIATSFKFVPWQSVAGAFPSPLVVDTRSFNPRGTALEQVDRLPTDVSALVPAGELPASNARNLQDPLKLARVAIQKTAPVWPFCL
jgi:hypothetical protein